ncbi:type IV pilus assembly protein PilM [Candidatus Latescibacterota bacterium]
MQLFRKSQSVIGLDIGTSVIKAVKITKKGKTYSLDNYALEQIEGGAVQSGEIKNPASLAQSALNAVTKCDKSLKDVVIALPNYSILSDVFTMDLVAKKDIRESVLIEAERLSPFDMSEVEIDYEVLEKDDEAKKMKVLMVAAKKDIIGAYIDCMNEAGLRTTVIDVDLFALLNIFHLNYDPEKYRSCIIINIGTDTTDAAFLQNGIFHSSRDIPVAGSNFQKQLESSGTIPQDKIHDILNGRIDPESDIEPVVKALNIVSKEFANAVGVAVSYFQTSDAVEKIDLILLSGGYSSVPGLYNILELRIGAEVVILNPFNNIDVDEKIISGTDTTSIGKVLSVAMGLATRA